MSAILIVEDSPDIRGNLHRILALEGYEVLEAGDGEAGWQLLREKGDAIHLVLLDRMMPRLDGMSLLARIRADDHLRRIPVVLQTAATSPEDIATGIAAGAYYYLTKPYKHDVLLAIVRAALADHRDAGQLRDEMRTYADALAAMHQGEFHIRHPDQARALATSLSTLYPDPATAVIGITELMINAIEHGNLGIAYATKTRLLQENRWREEIEHRLAQPELAKRRAVVEIRRNPVAITLTITDEGSGFDWRDYLAISPERAFDPNGRGIALARMVSFDQIDYRGNGNVVVATKVLPPL